MQWEEVILNTNVLFFSPLRKLIIMCEINCAKQLAF